MWWKFVRSDDFGNLKEINKQPIPVARKRIGNGWLLISIRGKANAQLVGLTSGETLIYKLILW